MGCTNGWAIEGVRQERVKLLALGRKKRRHLFVKTSANSEYIIFNLHLFFVATYFVKLKIRTKKFHCKNHKRSGTMICYGGVGKRERKLFAPVENRTKVLWYLTACLFFVPLRKQQMAVSLDLC
jgi:hypothetical protein